MFTFHFLPVCILETYVLYRTYLNICKTLSIWPNGYSLDTNRVNSLDFSWKIHISNCIHIKNILNSVFGRISDFVLSRLSTVVAISIFSNTVQSQCSKQDWNLWNINMFLSLMKANTISAVNFVFNKIPWYEVKMPHKT